MSFEFILRRSFPKLASISFSHTNNLKNHDLDEFLQLKWIQLQLLDIVVFDCRNVDGSIFEFFAKYTPKIEAIQIDCVSTTNCRNLKYFGMLKSIKRLKLCSTRSDIPTDQTFIPSLLNEIHLAHIQLQHLHVQLVENKNFMTTEQLVEAISKLRRLKTLHLGCIPNLKFSHIIDLCKQLVQLAKLNLQENRIVMYPDDLLELMKCATELTSLRYSDCGPLRCIGKSMNDNKYKSKSFRKDEIKRYVDTYMKMVQIVGQRRPKKHFLIELNSENPLKMLANTPHESMCNHVLTVLVHSSKQLAEWITQYMRKHQIFEEQSLQFGSIEIETGAFQSINN